MVEEQDEHPADAALAAYLWLLSSRDGDYSARAAETVLECKQCWWARKMAEHVRDQKKHQGTLQVHKGSWHFLSLFGLLYLE